MAETSTLPVKSGKGPMQRRDPFELLDTFQEEMARLWGQGWPFSGLSFPRRMGQLFSSPTMWVPRIDVFEKDKNLVIKAELPGAKKEDIEVTLDHGDLVLHGEHKGESEVKEESYYRKERSYGSFYRRIPLSFEVDANTIKATMTDGVLEIQIPMPAEAQMKAQKIQVT